SGLIMIYFLRSTLPLHTIQVSFPLMKELLKDSTPIIFAEIAMIVYMRTDQVMIGEMIGASAVGVYSVAVRLSEMWYFIPGIICSSLLPSIVRAHSENTGLYKEKVQQLYDLLAGLSVGIAIIVS